MKKIKALILIKDGKPHTNEFGQYSIFQPDVNIRFTTLTQLLGFDYAECEVIIKNKK